MTRQKNAVLQTREYKEGADISKSMPQVVYIETTNTCNLTCPMCPITMGVEGFVGNAKFFPWTMIEQLKPFLETAKRCVMSGGGEPFLHPKFLDMIRFVKEAGAEIVFNTNGTLLTEKAAGRLVDLQADTVSFSVDAADPDIYASIRAGADLREVEKNIKRLARIKKEMKSQKPYLNLQMTLIRANVGEIIPVLEMAAEWAIQHVVVEPLSPVFSEDKAYADYIASNSVNADEVLPEIRVAQGRAGELGLVFSSHYLVMGGDITAPDPKNFRCVQPWINFGVRADGRIFPCCGTSHIMGDISDITPENIWNGEEYRALRRAFAKGQPPQYCNLCLQEGRAMFFNADLVGVSI